MTLTVERNGTMADLEMQAGVRIRVKFDNGFYAGTVAKWDPQKGRALVEFRYRGLGSLTSAKARATIGHANGAIFATNVWAK